MASDGTGSADSKASLGGSSPSTSAKLRLKTGTLYEAFVEDYDTSERGCVVHIPRAQISVRASLTSSTVAGLFGVRDHYKPPRGVKCLVLYGDTDNFIIRFFDKAFSDVVSGPSKSTSPRGRDPENEWDNNKENRAEDPEGGPAAGRGTPYADMVEGEYDFTNLLGCGVQFLTFLTRMTSGRAAVETHLLNDMVRILSGHFRHLHALGQTEIYEDGGLNMSFDGTPYPWEREGKTEKGAPLYETGERSNEVNPEDSDRYKDLMRGRLSAWAGWLGNMVNVFVTDPGKVLGDLADARSGRARLHVGQDGSILVQSVAEIAIERVTRIPVPIRTKRPNSPDAEDPDDIRDIEDLEHDWDGPDDDLLYPENVFKLREMSKVLSSHMSNFRFEKHPDYKVPSEAQTPAPGWRSDSIGEDQGEFVERYTTMRIMRDGSICMLDAYGSSIVTRRGHGHVSVPKHLTFEAGGDMAFISGQDMIFKARRSMFFTSVVGGIRMVSRAFMEALCQYGSVWLKSDYDPDTTPPAADEAPEVRVKDGAGVVLESSNGKTIHRSKGDLDVSVTGPGSDINVKSADGDISIITPKKILLSGGFILLRPLQDLVASGLRFICNFPSVALSRDVVVRQGRLHAAHIQSLFTSATQALRGPKVGFSVPEDNNLPIAPHWNHVLEADDQNDRPVRLGDFSGEGADPDDPDSFDNHPANQAGPELLKLSPDYSLPTTNALQFGHAAAEEYDWGGDFHESLTQQMIRKESAEFPDWKVWSGAADGITSGPGNNNERAYPGRNAKMKVYDGGGSLWSPASSKKTDTDLSAFSESNYAFRYWSREDANEDYPLNHE